jgi:putative two-component system response regulator
MRSANPLLATLVVDDAATIRSLLQKVLVRLGHEVTLAPDVATALAEASRRKFSCILLDVTLPDGSGVDLVPQLLALEPNAAIVMMTAADDAATAARSLQLGAMEYLVKPVELSELERAIARALERRRVSIEEAATQLWLQGTIVQREAELWQERTKLERFAMATLQALINALEAKDPYLRGHSARVADLSAMIAAELGLSDDQIERVRVAGRLHDIGKIGIHEAVLNKRGRLTDEEFAHVRTHAIIGAQILAPLTHLGDVVAFVRSHHERMDGTGYPDQLAGDAIPVGARILGAAEVYDALTTERPYQEKMSPVEAVALMRDMIGTVLTPEVHAALETVVIERGPLVFLDDREGKE